MMVSRIIAPPVWTIARSVLDRWPRPLRPVAAQPGDAENGAKIYAKRCICATARKAMPDSPAAERLNPPPRDFTLASTSSRPPAFR